MTEYRRAGMGEHGWWPRMSSLVDGEPPEPLYVAPDVRRRAQDNDNDSSNEDQENDSDE